MAGIRRTWDKSLYEQRAKDRIEKGDDFLEETSSNKVNRAKQALREEFRAAEANASGPIGSERAFLKARERKLGLEDKAGKIEIINPADVEGQKAGFWCEVCSVLLKDSASYLAHINGKKHQHALGYSMRVERASIDDVKERLQRQKSRIQSSHDVDITDGQNKKSALEEYEQRLKDEEEQKLSLKRKREEEAQTRKAKKRDEAKSVLSDDEASDEGEDEMAKMMGFKGFGSSKK